MKIGELRVDPATGGFIIQAPEGIRPVTLRVTHSGAVHVEEISGGGMTVQPLTITNVQAQPQGAIADWAREGARIANARRDRA